MAEIPGSLPFSCLIIANPAAGAVTTALVDDLVARCSRHGATVQLEWTRARGDATGMVRAAAAKPRHDRFAVVMSVGGDGTTCEVARGLANGGPLPDDRALFVVPAGTGNSNYRSHWGDRPWQEALDTVLADPRAWVRMLDLGVIAERGELVMLGAGAGLTAEVLNAAPSDLRGRDRLQAGLERAAARFTPYPGRVTVDGSVVHEGRTVFANVGGGRHRAWQYLILPHSILDDGLLDVCVVGAEVAPATVPELLREGRHLSEPGVVYRRGRRVVIERTDGLPLCLEHDGELVAGAGSRVTLTVLPAALPVLCDVSRHPGPAATVASG
jgi:diacylglycerol kinase (ATP)